MAALNRVEQLLVACDDHIIRSRINGEKTQRKACVDYMTGALDALNMAGEADLPQTVYAMHAILLGGYARIHTMALAARAKSKEVERAMATGTPRRGGSTDA